MRYTKAIKRTFNFLEIFIMIRPVFYTVVFQDADGSVQQSMTLGTLVAARKRAAMFRKFASNVRIMAGGAGGYEVK
ncbi:MAG: hypothetical protein Q7T25_14160 [Sideroxyarcus sp.]|nr:hypothetical protein [Sideroxyarcus sp.]